MQLTPDRAFSLILETLPTVASMADCAALRQQKATRKGKVAHRTKSPVALNREGHFGDSLFRGKRSVESA